jgi:DNA-binding transcriptional regulator/RsmH inhibitor MraZ
VLDSQGRVVLPPILRERAEMVGEVVVNARLSPTRIFKT